MLVTSLLIYYHQSKGRTFFGSLSHFSFFLFRSIRPSCVLSYSVCFDIFSLLFCSRFFSILLTVRTECIHTNCRGSVENFMSFLLVKRRACFLYQQGNVRRKHRVRSTVIEIRNSKYSFTPTCNEGDLNSFYSLSYVEK